MINFEFELATDYGTYIDLLNLGLKQIKTEYDNVFVDVIFSKYKNFAEYMLTSLKQARDYETLVKMKNSLINLFDKLNMLTNNEILTDEEKQAIITSNEYCYVVLNGFVSRVKDLF